MSESEVVRFRSEVRANKITRCEKQVNWKLLADSWSVILLKNVTVCFPHWQSITLGGCRVYCEKSVMLSVS